MDRELEIIIEIAKQAGQIVLGYYWWDQLQTRYKMDQFDPVTQADIQADAFIRAELKKYFPDDKILSEESDYGSQEFDGRVRMVDPLDGTKDFIHNDTRYSVMIWLCSDGKPELGAVYGPSVWDLYYAKRWQGSFYQYLDPSENHQPQQIHVSSLEDIHKARYFAKSKNSAQRPINDDIEKIFHFWQTLVGGSLGIVLGEIGRWIGECYILTNPQSCKWDLCAPQVILEEAGGKVSDVYGNEIDYLHSAVQLSHFFVASNSIIHDQLIEQTKKLFQKI